MSSPPQPEADSARKKEYRPSNYVPLAEQKALKAKRIKALQMKKKLKQQQELQRKKQEALDAELKRAQELANQRWNDCLRCLKESVPLLKSNPWLIVLEPQFIHDYLDSLTETLANLSKHEQDIDMVRRVLQEVYEAFVDVGRFAKYQPAFYISNPATIKRFVRLLEQVAHRGSDKALFPNVLSLLGPTFEREELYDLLADAKIVYSLMSFVRTDWMPTQSTLALLLAIIEQLSISNRLRDLFMADAGFEKLQGLSIGVIQGFTREQQLQAQQALSLFPPPKRPDDTLPMNQNPNEANANTNANTNMQNNINNNNNSSNNSNGSQPPSASSSKPGSAGDVFESNDNNNNNHSEGSSIDNTPIVSPPGTSGTGAGTGLEGSNQADGGMMKGGFSEEKVQEPQELGMGMGSRRVGGGEETEKRADHDQDQDTTELGSADDDDEDGGEEF